MDTQFRYTKLGLYTRLVLAAGLYALTAALQLSIQGFFAFVPLFIAWFFLALKPISNKPKDQGLEEWRAVSAAEIDRIADSIQAAKRLRLRLAGPAVLGVLALVACVIIAFVSSALSDILFYAFLDLALFSVPGLFFGKLRVFTPADMELKLPGFLAIMGAALPKDYLLTPYLRFDKDEEGLDVPEDMRFMLEPVRKPADLIGVQLQSAINNGANGKVPYMYAVVLTKGRTGLSYRALKNLAAGKYTVEAGGDEQYGTIVVRQNTGGTGYHTTPKHCVQLVSLMVKALDTLR
jgi:hypothetical protein